MTRVRELIAQYPAASAVIVAVVLAVAGWRIYQTMAGAPQAGRSTLSPSVSPAQEPATSPKPAAPAPNPRGNQAGTGGAAGASSSGGNPASTAPSEGGGGALITGRDPFTSPIGSGTGGGPPLPPVPPLAPGSAAGPGAGGPEAPAYRVAGIIRDSVALAIVEDGTRSYIVGPGDELRPGVRVTAIDSRQGIVRLIADGLPVELRMIGRGKAP